MQNDYRERAVECLRAANDMRNPEHRTAFLKMAVGWMRLSEQADRNSRADINYETPALRGGRQQGQQSAD
jgi:hypothetical protein